MRIRILGSAAGGGLPQWNCRCRNCEAARGGSSNVTPRTQSSVAVSAGGDAWFLLNVSADIRRQILDFPELGPPENSPRGTSVVGCVLTDAEIDHTSGLLQLREGEMFSVYSTAIVHRWLSRSFPIASILAAFADRPWKELALNKAVELSLPDGSPAGLQIRALATGGSVPRFVSEDRENELGAVVGLEVIDRNTGGRLVYAPGIEELTGTFVAAAERADCLLIDGTFWTDDEPSRLEIGHRTARQMGHLPVSDPCGSLAWVASLPARHRVYVHINNTNPMLDSSGEEYRQVCESGAAVGADGDEFEI